MKCALAAVGSVNGDIRNNQQTIIDIIYQLAGQCDIVIFGESFLQGFYAPVFDEEQDRKMALQVDSPVIQEIREAARECETGVSFGFFETDHDRFYSSQLTIDQTGGIVDLYRRVSPGWKEKHAGEAYCEGESFHLFELMGEKIAVGICGDLWYDENIEKIAKLKPDMVWWPVYTDFVAEEWNENIISDYAQQAGKINAPVLYVNSVCLDRFEENEIAKGGAAIFQNGETVMFTPSGEEGILLYD